MSQSFDSADASAKIVIVGAGQAAGQLALSLRSEGFAGKVIVLGEENHVPYQRPPLSKQFLAGEIGVERVYVKPQSAYADAAIDLRPGTRVEAINRQEKSVVLRDGGELGYDKLVLATGSRVRKLQAPGAELDNVFYLRTIEDMNKLKAKFSPGAKLVIAGGGYIGLEVASVAVRQGLDVTVLEMESRLMQRVVGPETASFYERVHTEHGVKIRFEQKVSHFAGDGAVGRVICDGGAEIEADLVLIGIGIVPEAALALAAGLEVDNGIVVDEYTRTSDADILAIGDCSNHFSARFQRRVRLESVPNALAQARVAAATLCGKDKPYTETPWFWSDQYDLKLQITGLSEGHDEVIMRGDPEQRQFMVCYLQNGELLAVESVNNMRDFMHCRQMVARSAKPDIAALADSGTALKDIAARTG